MSYSGGLRPPKLAPRWPVCQLVRHGVVWAVKWPVVLSFCFAASVFADQPKIAPGSRDQLVFVTGSLIPQRIKVRALGTATVSPLRVIDRGEIDHTGRVTTPGAFVNDPSVQILGH